MILQRCLLYNFTPQYNQARDESMIFLIYYSTKLI